ncbi:DUF4124 domain-containing protein [Hydrogenophaga aromaticivorans]|uniref:DUF4124 domain-containing protein n=1 Tax=Hydrogenophaga aromaticivorans TaxID=2610898 RepID=UPI0003F443F2|nr:hypothetical protein Y695_03081 [Hydrogenophaga sp. T4]MBQ0922229.1 DUF4124 domain-containing protein [Hydrogenophaga aromaticivorans]
MSAWGLLGRLALWVCLAGTGGAAMAQVYTWTDANGKKHFGDAATRPRDKTSPEVKVPPANLANRFEARQTPNPTPAAPESQSGQTMPGPTAQKISGVQRNQDACRAQWKAYDEGVACYAKCGKTVCRGFLFDCRRNNAECGHCRDAPMPRC